MQAGARMITHRVTQQVEYTAGLTIEEIVGNVFSATSPEQLPSPGKRRVLATRIRRALLPHEPCRESVRVAILTGCSRHRAGDCLAAAARTRAGNGGCRPCLAVLITLCSSASAFPRPHSQLFFTIPPRISRCLTIAVD
jgi:hypothetical protein